MDTNKESAYIDLLRFCLDPAIEISESVEDIDWHNLLQFAQKQTIAGVYWQGIQRLGDIDNKPSEDDVMEWMGEYKKITRRNTKIDAAVANFSQYMKGKGIGFYVFKGQTVAQYYPIPEMRTSGDIDFYVFKNNRSKALNELSKVVKLENHNSIVHLSFEKDEIPYEFHYHTAIFPRRSIQKYWDNMIDSYFDDALDNVEINGVKVPTLPPTINAIYLFIHIYHHFLKEGIALRQFVDWMMFFEAKHGEIAVPELKAKLDRLGLTRAFRAFGAVLIDVLGMDAKCFPLTLTDSDRKYEQGIMDIVLKYGNFGKYGRKEQQGGWLHSVETGLRSVRHLAKFFWLSPSENLLWLPKLFKHSIIKNTHKLLNKNGRSRFPTSNNF